MLRGKTRLLALGAGIGGGALVTYLTVWACRETV